MQRLMKLTLKGFKIMADISVIKSVFEQYTSTLKDTSLDNTNNQHLCHSQEEVYDFDRYIRNTAINQNIPSSFDALYFPPQYPGHIICIEFKNQIQSDLDMAQIKKKFEDGLQKLEDLFIKHNLARKDYHFELFVIYKRKESTIAASRARFENNPKECNLQEWAKDTFKSLKINMQIKCVQECKGYMKEFFSTNSNC